MTTLTVPAMSAEGAAIVERARGAVDAGRLAELVAAMTAVPSPTGEERALAELVVEHLRAAGVDARVQVVDADLANVVGRLPGAGDGPTLLLYAPLDTAWSGDVAEDEPWLGSAPRPDFAVPPVREGDRVIGLGAENPKAFAACAIAAIEALASVGARLRGDVVLTLAGGSMPVAARPGVVRPVAGLGAGIRAFLEAPPPPDFAIVLKPGYAVSHEEVGLAWFRITVRGAVNYTGIRHKGPYRNPIVMAARLITALEAWLPEYTAATSSGLVAPQGSINAIRAGSPDRASFIPTVCALELDLRPPPGMTADGLRARLEEALDGIRAADPELEVTVEPRAFLPGTRTDPGSWIVRALVGAWETSEGREHVPPAKGSGASDAAIIRDAGIPTARIGLPPPTTPSPYAGFSMGVVDGESMARLTAVLLHAIVDTAGRTRSEVGLDGTTRGGIDGRDD